jgi:hypothetical protein
LVLVIVHITLYAMMTVRWAIVPSAGVEKKRNGVEHSGPDAWVPGRSFEHVQHRVQSTSGHALGSKHRVVRQYFHEFHVRAHGHDVIRAVRELQHAFAKTGLVVAIDSRVTFGMPTMRDEHR